MLTRTEIGRLKKQSARLGKFFLRKQILDGVLGRPSSEAEAFLRDFIGSEDLEGNEDVLYTLADQGLLGAGTILGAAKSSSDETKGRYRRLLLHALESPYGTDYTQLDARDLVGTIASSLGPDTPPGYVKAAEDAQRRGRWRFLAETDVSSLMAELQRPESEAFRPAAFKILAESQNLLKLREPDLSTVLQYGFTDNRLLNGLLADVDDPKALEPVLRIYRQEGKQMSAAAVLPNLQTAAQARAFFDLVDKNADLFIHDAALLPWLSLFDPGAAASALTSNASSPPDSAALIAVFKASPVAARDFAKNTQAVASLSLESRVVLADSLMQIGYTEAQTVEDLTTGLSGVDALLLRSRFPGWNPNAQEIRSMVAIDTDGTLTRLAAAAMMNNGGDPLTLYSSSLSDTQRAAVLTAALENFPATGNSPFTAFLDSGDETINTVAHSQAFGDSLRTLTYSSPAEAVDILQRLPESSASTTAAKIVFESLSNVDTLTSSQYLSTMPPGAIRDVGIQELVLNLGSDTRAAATWVASMAEPMAAASSLGEYVGRLSAADAADFFTQLELAGVGKELIAAVVLKNQN